MDQEEAQHEQHGDCQNIPDTLPSNAAKPDMVESLNAEMKLDKFRADNNMNTKLEYEELRRKSVGNAMGTVRQKNNYNSELQNRLGRVNTNYNVGPR